MSTPAPDISPEAVERLAVHMSASFRNHDAIIAIRALRSALTASEKRLKDADWLIKNVHYRDDNRRDVWTDIQRMYDEGEAK